MSYTNGFDDPSSAFQTHLYSGSNSDITATFSGNSNLQPDWIWFKSRSSDNDHLSYDSTLGVNKRLQPNANDALVDRSGNNDELKSFNTNGWTLGTYNSNITGAGKTCVSWNWKKTAGLFDIVSFTGNSTNRTISHSLGVAPSAIIIKNTATTNDWVFGHKNLSNFTNHLYLNTSAAAMDDAGVFNDTAPTSSVFSVGGNNESNGNGNTMIAYLFGEKKNVSMCSSYVGNGDVNGPRIFLGFKPAVIIIKQITDGSQEWEIFDNKRDGFNDANRRLYPNSSAAEPSASDRVRFLANGFKLVTAGGTHVNGNGKTHIFIAIAEQSYVTSTGVPATAY